MSLLWKVFIALGGIGVMWGFATKGVPQLIAWLMPHVVAVVHRLTRWLLSKPVVRSAAVKYRPEIEEFLRLLVEGFKQIFDAALAAVDEDLDAEAKKDIPHS